MLPEVMLRDGVHRLTFPCPDLLLLMRRFHAAGSPGGVVTEFDDDKASDYLAYMLTHGVVFGFYRGGHLAGAIALHEVPWWWSRGTAWHDGFFFVDPDHRRSRVGAELLKAANSVAEQTGKPFFLFVMDSTDLERKQVWFERQGLQQSGAIFMGGAHVHGRRG